jgi:hypothetical protein
MAKIHTIDGVQYREVARQAKVGDAFLKVTKAWSPFFTEGKVYPIVKVEFSSPYVVDEDGDLTALHDSKYVVLEPVAADLSALESELAAMKAKVAEMERQLAEALEAKRKREEAAKWAAIGRKPGEFKVGDIAEVVDSPAALPNGTLFEVKEVGGRYVYDHKGYVYMSPGKQLKLVAPVESVVNLRGGDVA